MKQRVTPQLPKGFEPITGGGTSSFKPEKKGTELTGVLVAVKTVHFDKEGKRPARDVKVFVIKTKTGDVSVWESAALRALGNVKKGRSVFIRYLGKRLIKKGQSPMRDYLVAVK